jgi:hypothetical protein
MNYDNPEPLKFVTPQGEFRYSWLVEPDTKFDKCDYKVEVLIPAEQGAKIIDDLEAYLAEWKQACMKAKPTKTDWKTVDSLPWGMDEDSKGKPCVRLKCKRKAKGIKKGTNPPEVWEFKVPIYDSKGCVVTQREPLQKLGPGTIGRVSLQARPYEANIGVGLVLSIQSVQIIKVVEYTQQGEGFDAVEGGWTEDQATAPAIEHQQAPADW